MVKRFSGLFFVILVAAIVTGCETRVSDPWLGASQRDAYGADQIQRNPETAVALRHRLEYRMAER